MALSTSNCSQRQRALYYNILHLKDRKLSVKTGDFACFAALSSSSFTSSQEFLYLTNGVQRYYKLKYECMGFQPQNKT